MDSALKKMLTEPFQLISAHDALALLRALCNAPKFMHVIRSLSRAGHRRYISLPLSFS